MDVALAKEFILLNDYGERDGKIYISKDLNKLLEINDNGLIGIYGVIDTENGEKMMTMDWSYSREPLLMSVFLHKKFFVNNYSNRTIVNI